MPQGLPGDASVPFSRMPSVPQPQYPASGPQPQYPTSGAQPQYPTSGSQPRMGPGSRTPSRPNQPVSGEGLYPGVSLQGGRLRVLAPFGVTRGRTEAGNAPLNQWVATDMGRRGDRVVLLELPINTLPTYEANTIRENIASRLRVISAHPNLQTVLGSFTENGRHYLVLEFIEGEFILDRVRSRDALPERTLLRFAKELLDALEWLTRQSPSAIHGLIAPDTIVISPDESSIVITSWSPYIIAKSLNITLPGPIPVLAGYSSPELQRGQIETRGDVYSVGATLYFAATGNDNLTRSAGIFLPIRQYNAAYSAPTEAVLAKSVRLVPSQRYQHAEEMQLDIERARRGEMPTRDAADMVDPIFQRRNVPVISTVAIMSVLLVVVLLTVFVVRGRATTLVLPTAQSTATVNPTAIALANLNEGISDGTFIFDKVAIGANNDGSVTPIKTTDTMFTHTATGGVLAELDGAKKLRSGDVGAAIADFQTATQDDPTNPEARIYLANAQILASKTQNFITVTIGVSFSSDDLSASRQVLRGVALAQDRLNHSDLPGQVRIVIASVGSDAQAAPAVAQYVADQIAKGNPQHAVGVISWSPKHVNLGTTNVALVQALKNLAAAHVPVLAPLTTADQIPANPYFFQLTPRDDTQGAALAQTALTTYGAHRVVLAIDPSTLRNIEIGVATQTALVKQLGNGNVIVDQLNGTTVTATKVAQDVADNNADIVIYAGDDVGTIAMVKAMTTQGIQVPILATPSADTTMLLGVGDSPEAQYAKAHGLDMSLVHVMSLADVAEWGTNPPSFFTDFTNRYIDLNDAFTPDANAILSFDATNIVVKSLVNKGAWTASQEPSPQNLRDALAAINTTLPFQGISGRIAFDSANNNNIPQNRSLLIKHVTVSKTVKDASGIAVLQWTSEVLINGQSGFCNDSSCLPS